MPTVSLIDTGVQLGRTSGQQVKLGSLRDNGYGRSHSTSGYKRVNPFEVEAGRADDPDRADNLHYLGNWVGYDQNALAKGSQVAGVGGYGEATLTWTLPAGYSRAPGLLNQKVWAKGTGYTGDSPGETETSTDPTDTPDNTDFAGDVEEYTISLASLAGEWVALAVVATFNDSVTTHIGDSTDTYTPAAGETALTGASDGVLVKVYDTTPTISNVDQSPTPSNCSVGSNVTIEISCSMEGPSLGTLQEKVDGGSWSTVDSSIPAGSSSIDLTRASGHTYDYRLSYNDVSPTEWSNTGTHFADCDNV